jgi:hypothetical protein
MRALFLLVLTVILAAGTTSVVRGQLGRSYRLTATDLKQRVIWGAQCRTSAGEGLAFGGQDQDAADGRPHTRVLVDGQWQAIDQELRDGNPLQPLHERVWSLRCVVKNVRARARFIYFQGLPNSAAAQLLGSEVVPAQNDLLQKIADLIKELKGFGGKEYERGQAEYAIQQLEAARRLVQPLTHGLSTEAIQSMRQAQIDLELAAAALGAEPPPRALDCGAPRIRGEPAPPPARALVYDPSTKLYVLFGGDHLDCLTNDTWVFDPSGPRWYQRHPEGAPPPRANHRLEVLDDGKIRMTGGYTYTSNTDYCGGQYASVNDGEWIYDIRADKWSGGGLVPADSRTYRTGPFHPDYYLQGDKPNAAEFQAWIENLPVNQWVATDPPCRPRLNRDWGTARIDPDRDMMLRWSGGHSAHGGTDVPHYHFATNRWELPFPVEFPLGQLYSNTSYPRGFNFNWRPWMTGHTYQNYAYDPPSKKMVKAGRPRHFYTYDPDIGDWIGRGQKPPVMIYNSCFYTLTLTATPHGAMCWGGNGKVCLFNHAVGEWAELELMGDPLPGAKVDNSTIAYDSTRDRALIFNTPGYRIPYDGRVWALDMKSKTVTELSPEGMEQAHRIAQIDRCCYDPANDLVLIATYLKDEGDWTATPAYDCATYRWVTLDLKYETGERLGRTSRAFPHGRSGGVMFDPQRRLIWGTDTNSQVYVLRLDRSRAKIEPLHRNKQ